MSPMRSQLARSSAERAHQPEGTGARAVTAWAAFLLLSVALISILIWLLCLWFTAGRPPVPPFLRDARPGQAFHWARPVEDLARVRAIEERRLDRYGWVDRDRGIARIPITRAMALIAEGQGPAEPVEPATPEGEDR